MTEQRMTDDQNDENNPADKIIKIDQAYKNPPQVVTVTECSSCGSRHDQMEIRRYTNPQPPFTHWFTCPTTGDPCQVSITSYQGQPVSVAGEVLEMLAQAAVSGRYIVAVGRVEDGLIHSRRKSVNFPTGDNRIFIADLKKMLDAELDLPEEREMERANPPARVNLFGD